MSTGTSYVGTTGAINLGTGQATHGATGSISMGTGLAQAGSSGSFYLSTGMATVGRGGSIVLTVGSGNRYKSNEINILFDHFCRLVLPLTYHGPHSSYFSLLVAREDG